MKQPPLARVHEKAGAVLGEVRGWRMPLRYGLPDGWTEAVLADWSHLTKLDVGGRIESPPPAGVRFLDLGGPHGLVLLDPDLRSEADAWIAREQFPVTDVTGGYACFELRGSRAGDILAKLTSACPSEADSPGGVTQCRIAHAPGILFRSGRDFWILTPADYAQCVWESLLEAGGEFHLRPAGIEETRPS